MKRLFVLIPMLLFGLVLFAQEPEPPTDVFQWFGAAKVYLGSFWGVAVSLPFWAAIFIGLFNQVEASKVVKYLLTGVVALILLLLAYFLPFGYLKEAYWWWIIPNFVGLMVIEILAYSIPMIKAVLDAIAEKFNPWKPSG
jgi:hypothetical protein